MMQVISAAACTACRSIVSCGAFGAASGALWRDARPLYAKGRCFNKIFPVRSSPYGAAVLALVYISRRPFMGKLRCYSAVLSATLLADCINIDVVRRIEKIDVDHAIPPMGNIVETGTLVYEEKETGFFAAIVSLFSPKKERIPAKGEILARGSYAAQGTVELTFGAYPQKNKNIAQTICIYNYRRYYKWKGDIMFSGKTHEASFLIDAYGPKSGKGVKTFLLDTARTEFFRFEFSGHIGDADFETLPESGAPSFPWWVGDFISDDKTYRLYAVVEIGQEYEYPPGFKDPYAYETRKTFFYPEQKFQIAGESSNTVLAEIHNNAYTLYDTTPEPEREAMKCNIDLFYAVLQASKQIDASSSW
jgi:hypothetical protein